jgi:preprotein translocase subunit SecF
MEFFPPGLFVDFMKIRPYCIPITLSLAIAGFISMFWPGPKYGTDFRGGTELEIAFKGEINPENLRNTISSLGYSAPDVVNVQSEKNQYIIRILEVTSISSKQISAMRSELSKQLGGVKVAEFKVSPGGDKVSLGLSAAVENKSIEAALDKAGVRVKEVTIFGPPKDFRYEARLVALADELVQKLQKKLGDIVPDSPLRVEWVGPKAGEKLRDSAIMSVLWAITFIMVYVAFRFDLRFAPGGVIALIHDVLITLLVLVVFRREVNVGTIAALLTVVGYSINDTIVIYDRIRENMAKMRDTTLAQLINISTSQTMSRTVITSFATLLSIIPFFWWGTPVIQDITLALFVGIFIGTYSSIYIAAPITEWIDTRFFRKTV